MPRGPANARALHNGPTCVQVSLPPTFTAIASSTVSTGAYVLVFRLLTSWHNTQFAQSAKFLVTVSVACDYAATRWSSPQMWCMAYKNRLLGVAEDCMAILFPVGTCQSQRDFETRSQTIVNPLRTQQILHSNKCSTILQDWCLRKMRSQDWKQFFGKIIHGNTCHCLVMKPLSILNAQKSTSSQILCCVLERFIQHPESNEAWKKRIEWIINEKS